MLSPGTQWLFNKFGLSSSLRILGAVHVVLFACGATFGPLKGADVPSPGTKKRIKYFDWTICKNRAFLVYMIALVFVMLGYLVPYVHLVSSIFTRSRVKYTRKRLAGVIHARTLQTLSLAKIRKRTNFELLFILEV